MPAPETRAVTPDGTFDLAPTATPLPTFAAARPTAAVVDPLTRGAGVRPVALLPAAAPAAVTAFPFLLPPAAPAAPVAFRASAADRPPAPFRPVGEPGAADRAFTPVRGALTAALFAVRETGFDPAPEAAGLIGVFLAGGIGVFPPCE
ncbi:hypothetical protein Acy02nite_09990 [Actinoplanes cyaneus]|uniref:Uncharacterized protein n=1 Tax=Actinoplanes cyaneus TaxID=52696 RepID=A0A919IGN1_9ACTN|nr:hypothetical protein Acy02nite_09990 [Actinoplanes cyaneus]